MSESIDVLDGSGVRRAASPAVDPDHLWGLDFLRGVAAVGVVQFHLSTRLDLPFLFHHGYLAVDFFFVLSGLVVAKSYSRRLMSRRISLRQFAVLRMIRLMPLIALGTLLAGGIEVGRPGIVDQHSHWIDGSIAVVCGIFLVPTLWTTTLDHGVFPLNSTSWSLLLEIIANAVFAGWVRARLGPWVLIVVIGASATSLVWGVSKSGGMDFGALAENFWLGFPRVAWSFALGTVLYRIREFAPRVPFPLPILILVAVMLMPPLKGALAQAFDVASVFLVLPWIVWAASSARFTSSGRQWCLWSGNLSYPIYALHFSIVRIFGVIGTRIHLEASGRLGMAVAATVVVMAVSLAAYVSFDVPTRRWLISKAMLAARNGTFPMSESSSYASMPTSRGTRKPV